LPEPVYLNLPLAMNFEAHSEALRSALEIGEAETAKRELAALELAALQLRIIAASEKEATTDEEYKDRVEKLLRNVELSTLII
jgi:hypothetical protein